MTLRRILAVLLVFASSFCSGPSSSALSIGPAPPRRLPRMGRRGQPVALARRKQVIYTRTWIDKLNDKRESSVWLMNADGTKTRFLVKGSDAKWSPDGSRIAYIARVSRAGRRCASGTWTPRARRRRSRASRTRRGHRLVARRQDARLQACWCDSTPTTARIAMPASRRVAPSGRSRRAWSTKLDYRRTAGLHSRTACVNCSPCPPMAARRVR